MNEKTSDYPIDPIFRQMVDDAGGNWWLLISGNSASICNEVPSLAGNEVEIERAMQQIEALKNMSTERAFELALSEPFESSPALGLLQTRDSRDVFDRAVALCQSREAMERAAGVLILMRKPGMAFKDEAAEVVRKLAAGESDDRVLGPLAFAFRHLDIDDEGFLCRVAESPNDETRFAAAYALGGYKSDISIATLIGLMSDPDEEIRNWATFGLQLSVQYSDELRMRQDIRDAFFDRTTDEHDETRYEALLGLAMCKDPRVVEPLRRALEDAVSADSVWDQAFEAAREIRDEGLLEPLKQLEGLYDDPLLEQAIRACSSTPKDGGGDEIS